MNNIEDVIIEKFLDEKISLDKAVELLEAAEKKHEEAKNQIDKFNKEIEDTDKQIEEADKRMKEEQEKIEKWSRYLKDIFQNKKQRCD